MYPRGAEAPDRRGVRPGADDQPRRGGRPRQLVRPGVPRQRRRAQPAAASTRSSPTSTATAGCSAPSSRRTARASCSTTTATSSPTSTPQQLQAGDRRCRSRSRSMYRSRDDDADASSAAEQPLATQRDGVPVHLMDIHLEKGMHCVDCHFVQDVHGNTRALRRGAGGDRDPVHRLPRHRRRSERDAAHDRPGGVDTSTPRRAAARPQPGGDADAVRQAAVRAARRQDLSRTRWSRRT